MIRFHYHHTPNPMKVALFLEEAALPYEVVALDTFKGDQHSAEYRRVNPNGKAPAIEDDGVRVFDSNAILLYLAEKYGKFYGRPEDRAELYSWLMWIASGLGPFSGQWVHFQTAGAAEGGDYAKRRYRFEAHRHYEVLDKHLEGREFIVGPDYTIVDISGWGWVDRHVRVLGEGGIDQYPHVKRWFESVNARPAVARARAIGSDIAFKKDFDEATARAMFPSNFAAE
ncbi:MAG: glutathione S-transferase family protein [Paracoccaceae bacterium]